jgi:hypothetical protein
MVLAYPLESHLVRFRSSWLGDYRRMSTSDRPGTRSEADRERDRAARGAARNQAPQPSGGGGGTARGAPAKPGRVRRIEYGFVRLIATFGVVGIGVALGAILADNKVQGWIIGLVIAALSVVLSAVIWTSRRL